MSKWTLQVTPGEGRLTRRGGRILFIARPDPALAELAGPGLDIGVRDLAGYAVTNERCPAFVFIDLDNAMLLAHAYQGLEDLSEDSPPLRASSLGFVEGPVTPASILGCNHGPDSADTSLDEGTVPAAGFLLLGPESMLESSVDDAPAASDSVAGWRTAQPATPMTEASPTVLPGTDEADVTDDEPIPSTSPGTSDSAPGDSVDDWDPWQRDPCIDLDLIGSPTPAAAPSAQPSAPPGMLDGVVDPPPSAPSNTFGPVDGTDLSAIAQPASAGPAPEAGPGFASTDGDTLPPIPGIRAFPPPAADTIRDPIGPDLRATVPADHSVGSSDSGTGHAIQLRFDDGQVHTIRAGAIVGRNPNREQVPAGFTAITIRSEHVSRRHWRVDFIHGRPTVFDLGSQAGTMIQTTDGSRAVSNAGVAVHGDERIVFADRWATVERL